MDIRKGNLMNIIVAILILGIIVLIHELGHFLLAKKNGITVTEFSIGMGPRLASFVYRGTRYSLKLLPIGGSCMMLGEDELIEDDGAFNRKGVWARFSVIFAGAFFNFILAYVLSLIFLGNIGVDKPYINQITPNSPAKGILLEGDEITEINGSAIHFGKDIYYYLYFNPITEEPIEITYRRDGAKERALVTPQWLDRYMLGCSYDGSDNSAELKAVTTDYPLEQAGLRAGDVIININGTQISSGKEFSAYMEANPMNGEELQITYLRGGKEENKNTVKVTPKLVNSSYSIGFDYNMYYEKVSALQVVKYSFYEVRSEIVNTIRSLFYLITGKISAKEISGPVGIVNYVDDIVTETRDSGIRVTILSLIQFSILISANLGVMNLLPLPALDGGRLVFLLIEAIFRKPIPKEKEAMVHAVGIVLLMILMVLVLFNDIKKLF